MSAGSIIHVGTDDCYRAEVFKIAGYLVNSCTSLNQLYEALNAIPTADAVAISEGVDEIPRAISLTRATSSIPLILFQGVPSRCKETDFDLIVPAFTDPQEWLAEIRGLIEESRAIRSRTAALCETSALLRRQSRILSRECAAAREQSWLERQRSRMEANRNRRG